MDSGRSSTRTVVRVVGGIATIVLVFSALALWASCGSNEQLAMLAVRLPWPERALSTIVRKGQLDSVRVRALQRMASYPQSKFVDLALDPALPPVIHKAAAGELYANGPDQLAVIGRTSDPELCVDMINKATSSWATAGAVLIDRIANQQLLYAVAVGAQAAAARELAVRKLTDQEQLFRCAEHDASRPVRNAAIERLNRDDLIVGLFRSRAGATPDVGADKKSDDVCAATGRLKDKSLLARLATADPNADVRMMAVSCLWDAVVLALVVANDPSWDVRTAAVKHLYDESLLLRLAHDRSRPLLRGPARDRLFGIVPIGKDQFRLQDLAVRHPDPLIRQIAATQLTNRQTLARIAAKDRSPEVRQAARAKIESLQPLMTTGFTSGSGGGVPAAFWHDPPRNHSTPGMTVSVPGRP